MACQTICCKIRGANITCYVLSLTLICVIHTIHKAYLLEAIHTKCNLYCMGWKPEIQHNRFILYYEILRSQVCRGTFLYLRKNGCHCKAAKPGYGDRRGKFVLTGREVSPPGDGAAGQIGPGSRLRQTSYIIQV